MEITNTFIDKYSSLVTDNICRMNNIDPQDQYTRAILAWNMLNPDNPMEIQSPINNIKLPIEFIYKILSRCTLMHDILTNRIAVLNLPYDMSDFIIDLPTYINVIYDHPFGKTLNSVFKNTVEACMNDTSSIKEVLLQKLKETFGEYIFLHPDYKYPSKSQEDYNAYTDDYESVTPKYKMSEFFSNRCADDSDNMDFLYEALFDFNEFAYICESTINKRTSSKRTPNWNPVQFHRFVPAQFINMYLDLRSALTDYIIPNNIYPLKRVSRLPRELFYVKECDILTVYDNDNYKLYKGRQNYEVLKFLYTDIVTIDNKLYKVCKSVTPGDAAPVLVEIVNSEVNERDATYIIGKDNMYITSHSHGSANTLARGAVFAYVDYITYYKHSYIPTEFSVDKIYATIKYYENNPKELANFIKTKLPIYELEDYRNNWDTEYKSYFIRNFWTNVNTNNQCHVPEKYTILPASVYLDKLDTLYVVLGKLIYDNEKDNLKSQLDYVTRFPGYFDNVDTSYYNKISCMFFKSLRSVTPYNIFMKYYKEFMSNPANNSIVENAPITLLDSSKWHNFNQVFGIKYNPF